MFRELLNDEYMSFDPHDETDVIKKIQQFLTKKPVFDYKHIVPQYSFEEMTKKTLEVYSSCL